MTYLLKIILLSVLALKALVSLLANFLSDSRKVDIFLNMRALNLLLIK